LIKIYIALKMTTKTIEIHDELLMQIDAIAYSLNLTWKEWIMNVLSNAVKRENTHGKILDVVLNEYMEGKIDFNSIISLIGYNDAVRIKNIVDGAKRSITEADEFAKN